MNHYLVALAIIFLCNLCARTNVGLAEDTNSTLRVPAFSAFVEPDPVALKVSERRGITGWTNAAHHVAWFGEFKATGDLSAALVLRLPAAATTKLQLTVDGASAEAEATSKGKDEAITLNFGKLRIKSPGYHRLTLAGLDKSDRTYGDLEALVLSGPAMAGAHFSLVERRNAASVHLGFPVPRDAKAAWFYNEVTVRTEPLWSYYMACGFHRGYCGIQVNSPTERRIIFSVWDSGNEAVDRGKVAREDRVQLVAKGENVVANDFGNEGTGGHSHLIYAWKKDQPYRFVVTAQPDGNHTTYAGYFYFPEKNKWGLIASFRAPKDGGYMRGLYSFNENFLGANGHLRRLAEFGNQWIKTGDGAWVELVNARFTHDGHGKAERKDYGAGVIDNRFYLSNGGFIAEPIKYGDTIMRPATGKQPMDIDLP